MADRRTPPPQETRLTEDEVRANYQRWQVARHASYDRKALRAELSKNGLPAALKLGQQFIALKRLEASAVAAVIAQASAGTAWELTNREVGAALAQGAQEPCPGSPSGAETPSRDR